MNFNAVEIFTHGKFFSHILDNQCKFRKKSRATLNSLQLRPPGYAFLRKIVKSSNPAAGNIPLKTN